MADETTKQINHNTFIMDMFVLVMFYSSFAIILASLIFNFRLIIAISVDGFDIF